ncbi:MAG: DUF494 family protein [Ignavibacteriaceae bacterium]|nr:DUF494 family protein [Ignavibacteriaceae bacterium]
MSLNNSKNKVFDIIGEIMDSMVRDQSIEELQKTLTHEKKYELSQIATAFSWVYDKFLANKIKNHEIVVSNHQRVFNEEEISILGIHNCNKLLKLANVGFLTHDDINFIIENFAFSSEESLLSEFNLNFWIIAPLFELDNIIVPGSRTILRVSDSIN